VITAWLGILADSSVLLNAAEIFLSSVLIAKTKAEQLRLL
jgi:hypothetical protein